MNRQAWFTDITATGPDNAWAVGAHSGAATTATTGGFAIRWNGKRWLPVRLPVSPFVPVSVSARGRSGIWIFGYRPALNSDHHVADALVFTDGHWRILPLPLGPTIFWEYDWDLQSAVVSGRDVWVIGSLVTVSHSESRSVLWNWNGSRWSSHPLPVSGADSVSAVPGAVWVTTVATDRRTTAYQWTGRSWRRWRLPYVTDGSIAADSGDNVWIGGAGKQTGNTTYMLHWNGRRWSRAQTPLSVPLGDTFADGHGGVWFSQWAHRSGRKWYEPSAWPTWRGCNGNGTGALAPVPGTTAVWFAGVCQSGRANFDRPILGITGRL
jgi:hypothetical protein